VPFSNLANLLLFKVILAQNPTGTNKTRGISLPNSSIILSNQISGANLGLVPLKGGLQRTRVGFFSSLGRLLNCFQRNLAEFSAKFKKLPKIKQSLLFISLTTSRSIPAI